jgi:asparagine synthetase B (glutamine-hydrolysing)
VSGVFGVVAPGQQIDICTLTDKMAAIMSHREWFVADHFVDHKSGVALGRIGIGIFNKGPQPVWNASHTVALVMAGEFYD